MFGKLVSWAGSAGLALFVVVAGVQIVRGSANKRNREEQNRQYREMLAARTEPPAGGLAQPPSTPPSVSMPLPLREKVIARLFKDGWGNLVALPACSACKRETAADATRCGSCQITLTPAPPGTLKCPNCNGKGGWFPCSKCKGTGEEILRAGENCDSCRGKGTVGGKKCLPCRGSGRGKLHYTCAWCQGDGTKDCHACNRRGIIN